MKTTTTAPVLYAIIIALALSTTGCALGITSIGADLIGPPLNAILDPVGTVKPCPECPKSMTALDYIKKQQEMLEDVRKAAMKQYTEKSAAPCSTK